MASLISAGFALAQNTVPSEKLTENAQSEFEQDFAGSVQQLPTVLQSEYLLETANTDVWKGKDYLLQTPTDLGFEACQQALDRAGLTADQIGLIVGSCSTPLETTPSEAQRVGQRLGIKVPAYDVYSGGADFSLYLRNLLRWKKDRTPEYVLFFSTNCPTTRTRYDQGLERHLFSDAAGAVICSLTHSGPFAVERSEVLYRVGRSQEFSIELYGHLCFQPLVESEVLVPGVEPLLSKSLGSYVLENQLSPKVSKELCTRNNKERLGGTDLRGSCLGAGPFVALAENWDSLLKESRVSVLSSGMGLSMGITELARVE